MTKDGKMKLVFFIDNQRKIGGGEYAQFLFAKELATIGHQVVVFAGDKHFASKDFEGLPNLIIRYRRTIPIFIKRVGLGKLNALWENIHGSLVILPFLKTFKPDWVVGYLRKSAIKAQRLGKKAGIPIANFIFESPPWMARQLGKRWDEEMAHPSFRRSWQRTKYAYRNSTVLLPNSKLAGKECKAWLADASVSEPVYPGVNLNFLNEKTRKKNKELAFDLLYIGRLNALKNVDELLLACTKTNKSYRIAILGQGEERSILGELAKQHKLDVTFFDDASDELKWSILCNTKLLVFPTSFEGFGMPPLEALAAGSQALCTNLPILKEVYGNHIYYYPEHDVDALAKNIDLILSGKKNSLPSPAPLLNKYTLSNAAATIVRVLRKYGPKVKS